MPSQLASLVTRHGGEAVIAPALLESPLPMRRDVQDVIEDICSGAITAVVFLTGVGARALITAAGELGREDEFLTALRSATVLCRGPKPVAVLRPLDVPLALVAPEPYTSEDLVDAIRASDIDLAGRRIALQHYGEVNAWLRQELEAMGADVREISLYAWQLPVDVGPVVDAIQRMIARDVDGVLFTTQAQAHNLFRVAADEGLTDGLQAALSADVVVASVGPVCTRALRKHGVEPRVQPGHPKMGPLVIALAEHLAAGESARAGAPAAPGA